MFIHWLSISCLQRDASDDDIDVMIGATRPFRKYALHYQIGSDRLWCGLRRCDVSDFRQSLAPTYLVAEAGARPPLYLLEGAHLDRSCFHVGFPIHDCHADEVIIFLRAQRYHGFVRVNLSPNKPLQVITNCLRLREYWFALPSLPRSRCLIQVRLRPHSNLMLRSPSD